MQHVWPHTCMSSQLDPGILLLEGHDKWRPVHHVLNLLPRLVLQRQACDHPSIHQQLQITKSIRIYFYELINLVKCSLLLSLETSSSSISRGRNEKEREREREMHLTNLQLSHFLFFMV